MRSGRLARERLGRGATAAVDQAARLCKIAAGDVRPVTGPALERVVHAIAHGDRLVTRKGATRTAALGIEQVGGGGTGRHGEQNTKQSPHHTPLQAPSAAAVPATPLAFTLQRFTLMLVSTPADGRLLALADVATQLRVDSVRATTAAGSGHPTS